MHVFFQLMLNGMGKCAKENVGGECPIQHCDRCTGLLVCKTATHGCNSVADAQE